MIASQCLDRINASVTGLAQTGLAVDLASIMQAPVKFPAVWVLPGKTSGGQNRLMTGAVSQKQELLVQVILAVRKMTGKGVVYSDIEQLVAAVDGVLFGWSVTELHDPLTLVNGGLIKVQDGQVWWQQTYKTSLERRSI